MKNNLIYFLTALLLVSACSSDRSDTFTIAGYNCDAAERVVLTNPLKEISGLAYDAERNAFLAINDEQGIVFVLDPVTYTIKYKMHFADKGDYEEIQLWNNSIYVLRSDGVIFKMTYDGNNITDVTQFDYDGAKAEYESFFIHPENNQLILITKNSKESKSTKITTGYSTDAGTGKSVAEEIFKLDRKHLQHAATLHPSAVAVHPHTKQLYILASIEKILLVADTSGNIQAQYALPLSLFQQPEGIAFDQNGNMYISNEAAGYEPTIIKIPVK